MSRVLPYNAKQWEIPLLLDGRKTVTRRIVKIPYELEIVKIVGESGNINNPLGAMYLGGIKRPPYQPGDILYVRETYKRNMDGYSGIDFGGYIYKTDCHSGFKDLYNPWRPSIHMPKEAARIWLKVTDVRVERLRDTTDESAKKEGFSCRDEFIQEFLKIYPECTEESWLWVIEFERCDKPESEG